ncbi:YggS family pyridoxal phosphate-dependent enzyme [bacterium]|nr:YggS family pyridoxal phosphate-dependent enzyme [bacterium]
MSIAGNIKRVYEEIGEAASRAGRDPSEVVLLAVTKTRTVREIEEAAAAGIVHFGENRVQEASSKIPDIALPVIWHMIGPLQSNKVKPAAALFEWIDSIHSKKIVDLLSERAAETGRIFKVLIQVNISGESAKSGVPVNEVRDLVACAAEKRNLDVRGLMTLGSFGVTREVTRSEFARMRDLFDSFRADPELAPRMEVLSMGMSDDFTIAVEEGSTMVRVGTAIFGKRI